MVFENKVKPDELTLRAVLEKLKARMVVDGGPTVMTKHVHYEETFSATPKLETCRLTVVLRVLLKLESLCFDVSNAFRWAARVTREKPMALCAIVYYWRGRSDAGGGITTKPQLRPLGGVSCGAAPGEPGHIKFGISIRIPSPIPS